MFDFTERWLLELAIFDSEQLRSVRETGDILPEKEGCEFTVAIMEAPMSDLIKVFHFQLEDGKIFDWVEAMGRKSFIAPNGDIYNRMDDEWYITVK